METHNNYALEHNKGIFVHLGMLKEIVRLVPSLNDLADNHSDMKNITDMDYTDDGIVVHYLTPTGEPKTMTLQTTVKLYDKDLRQYQIHWDNDKTDVYTLTFYDKNNKKSQYTFNIAELKNSISDLETRVKTLEDTKPDMHATSSKAEIAEGIVTDLKINDDMHTLEVTAYPSTGTPDQKMTFTVNLDKELDLSNSVDNVTIKLIDNQLKVYGYPDYYHDDVSSDTTIDLNTTTINGYTPIYGQELTNAPSYFLDKTNLFGYIHNLNVNDMKFQVLTIDFDHKTYKYTRSYAGDPAKWAEWTPINSPAE